MTYGQRTHNPPVVEEAKKSEIHVRGAKADTSGIAESNSKLIFDQRADVDFINGEESDEEYNPDEDAFDTTRKVYQTRANSFSIGSVHR